MDETMTVLALTGPPAAGKSTAVGMLRDLGVPCIDTGEAVRTEAQKRYDDPDEEVIWSVAESIRDEHGPAGPTVITHDWIEEQHDSDHSVVCLSSLREQAEVDWLRNHVGPTLVVRIDADPTEREYRYVEQKLDAEDEPAVDKQRIEGLREELRAREQREMPYPDHDLLLQNDNDVSMHTVFNRLDHLTNVLQQ